MKTDQSQIARQKALRNTNISEYIAQQNDIKI